MPLVLWMPYARLTNGTYRSPSIAVGPAVIHPDTDDVWATHVGVARPKWLNIYREFPRIGQEVLGPPCRGSVVLADDPQWLRDNAQRLVAVLYFVGDRACLQGTPQAGQPAEKFYFRPLPLGSKAQPLVELPTKHGGVVEDEHSLKLTPPLSVRRSTGEYPIDLKRAEHAALVQLLAARPQHRLITACLHYYLAQTGDPMAVSFEQDFANYCASLEAAFDVVQGRVVQSPDGSTKSQGIFEQLAAALAKIYGDSPTLEDYARGLYTCRSIHDHGLSDFDPDEVREERHQAYLRFAARRGNYSVCRAMCRDVILRQLWDQPGGYRGPVERVLGHTDDVEPLLRRAFSSDTYWQRLKHRTWAKGSAQLLASLSGDDFDAFRELVVDLQHSFAWPFVEPPPESTTVRSVLRVLLDAHERALGGPAAADTPIGELVAAFNHQPAAASDQEIAIWTFGKDLSVSTASTAMDEVLASAAWTVASYFARV